MGENCQIQLNTLAQLTSSHGKKVMGWPKIRQNDLQARATVSTASCAEECWGVGSGHPQSQQGSQS